MKESIDEEQDKEPNHLLSAGEEWEVDVSTENKITN